MRVRCAFATTVAAICLSVSSTAASSGGGACGLLGSVDTPQHAKGVAVAGAVAYVADEGSGLQVIDVSNPEQPEIVGSVDTPARAGMASRCREPSCTWPTTHRGCR
jgi:hypothetical protein